MTVTDPLLTWSTPIDRSLLVEEGMVICPRRGVVDVETCLTCEHLLGLEGEWSARVVCSYPFPVAQRVADELAAGRRWSRRIVIVEEASEEEAGPIRPEDLLPEELRPDRLDEDDA